MDALRKYWSLIPNKWKLWIASFILGLIIVLIWDISTLLITLFILFVLSYLIFNLFGDKEARVFSQWSITEFFKRIRGMLIFALLPTVWELIKKPSLESIISICFIAFIALTIWEKFNEVISNFNKSTFSTRRKTRRC